MQNSSRLPKTPQGILISTRNMTGRPGYRTMEMIGGSSVSYLARTPCVPLFCTLCSTRVETEGLLDYQGRAGIISIVRWNLRRVIFGVDDRGPESQFPEKLSEVTPPETALRVSKHGLQGPILARICCSVHFASSFSSAQLVVPQSPKRSSSEIFARDWRKMRRNFGECFSQIVVLKFPGKMSDLI